MQFIAEGEFAIAFGRCMSAATSAFRSAMTTLTLTNVFFIETFEFGFDSTSNTWRIYTSTGTYMVCVAYYIYCTVQCAVGTVLQGTPWIRVFFSLAPMVRTKCSQNIAGLVCIHLRSFSPNYLFPLHANELDT
jgi:hypothetical protein